MEDIIKLIGGIAVVVVILVSLVWGAQPSVSSGSHQTVLEKNKESVEELLKYRKVPELSDSLDWENARMRYEFLNQADRIGWLYVFTAEGILWLETPVIGKLTATDTYITPMEEIKRSRASSDDPWTYFTVEMSDIDGTFGVNADGVFWFDPTGTYNELPLTSAIVYYSSERKHYDTPPLLQN